MPEKAKIYLRQLFNKFFKETFFPEQWKAVIIISILKPGKSHSISTNYRPIALTSCLCKTFERMINERLEEYLEMNNIYADIQSGCRRNRSALNHLVRLESEVRKWFAKGEHMLSAFFHLGKAYDMTWRHGILQDMHSAGLRGYLPEYIYSF